MDVLAQQSQTTKNNIYQPYQTEMTKLLIFESVNISHESIIMMIKLSYFTCNCQRLVVSRYFRPRCPSPTRSIVPSCRPSLNAVESTAKLA